VIRESGAKMQTVVPDTVTSSPQQREREEGLEIIFKKNYIR